MTNELDSVKNQIFSIFGDVAQSIGYSPIHGQIIGVLLVSGEPMPLQDIAKETGYSISMISLSLDLLEVLGVIKRIKKSRDRKLYIELSGDLLGTFKNAIVIRLNKSIQSSLAEFQETKEKLEGMEGKEKEKLSRTIEILEKEIKRLERYVNLLSGIKLP